ncbi:4-(cytidine 5'-diphospho)-2-C-methyl-D-erythritol kinase [Streptomyces mutabilis]|uniref:4-diphosphocytidyl-2-C-methyl-D-erythritol kinase n=1 Tax=Streptomyces mutabilis TaxID=67332 RepID=A0A086N7B3_9ACTN|nr:4-(cytidine 5'-diphospho)-2-C-methyl-D-erythritol kinase [Streptomyces mutabilis]KFG77031.1 4-diphosphocytidyl-2C-methyl-D-erythritol kinase [Streptomyces mutabilis]
MQATARVPAKVNVRLGVGPLRADGFHELVNVFLAVGLYDTVTVMPADRLRVTCSGDSTDQVPLDAKNLAIRAAALVAERTGRCPSLRIHIEKNIPVAGGMAGGSADAAGTLLACDALWGTGMSRAELLSLCAELGSDVPFALIGGAAIGTGRGERLRPVATTGTFHWVFAIADGGLSTPTVYQEHDRLARGTVDPPSAPAELLAALRHGDAAAMADHLGNDLQPAALSLRSSLADTLEAGTAAGALAALVSGSGPTTAFLVKDQESARHVAAALQRSGTCRMTRIASSPAPGATLVGADCLSDRLT